MLEPNLTLLKELRQRLTSSSLNQRCHTLIGRKFKRLTPYGFLGPSKRGDALWLCRCDCGTFTIAYASHLTAHGKRSCGKDKLPWELCYVRSKHGLSHTREYYIWNTMIQRCHNPNVPSYPDYGGRGIVVCERWFAFEYFIEDMGQPPTAKHTIDRTDNSRGYSPDNCKWQTAKSQARNTRRNRLITIKGETMCHAEAAERFSTTRDRIRMRLSLGWTPEEAVDLVQRTKKYARPNYRVIAQRKPAWRQEAKPS